MMNATQHSCCHGNNDNNNNHLKAQHSTPLYRRYEFPILAEDPQSFAEARADPLACNVNNDAVLVWHDVISCRDFTLSSASLAKSSIEDAFLELQQVAQAHKLARDDPDLDFLDSNSSLKNVVAKRGDLNDNECKNHIVDNLENPVVSRRRLYEQGNNTLYGSKLDSRFKSKNSRQHHAQLPCASENQYTTNHSDTYPDLLHNGGDLDCNTSSQEGVGFTEIEGIDKETVKVRNRNTKNDNRTFGERVQSFDSGDYIDSNRDSRCSQTASSKARSSQSGSISFLDNTGDLSTSRLKFDSGHFEDSSLDPLPLSYQPLGIDQNFEFNEHDGDYSTENLREYLQDLDFHTVRIEKNSKNDYLVKEDAYSLSEDYPDVFVGDTYEDLCIDTNFVEQQIPTPPLPSPSVPRTPRSLGKFCKHKAQSRKAISWRDETSILVQCENPLCGKISNLVEARKTYKNCHHCVKTYYCCRECRRQDWKRHKQQGACPGSRVSSACKKVLRHCNTDPEVKSVLSRLAMRGYLTHGRGCVMLGFPDLECAEEFVAYGFPMLELNPIYVSAQELSKSKMYGNIMENLLGTCRSYKPHAKFVLNVGVGLNLLNSDFYLPSSHTLQNYHHACCHHHHRHGNHLHDSKERSRSQDSDLGYGSLSNSINLSKDSMVSSQLKGSSTSCFCSCLDGKNPSHCSSSSKHKGPILQRFIKLRLNPVFSQQGHEKRWTFEDHFWDQYRTSGPTLILTSIPECSGDQTESKKRELTFINIQRKLRQRNVNLRRQYPAVYALLIDYVTKGIHFPSQILFPVDAKTGRTFTCFMMPEVEAELEWMQSHHLLNDLELSKSSLDKSMSRSVSSSMPSLVGYPDLDPNSSAAVLSTDRDRKTKYRPNKSINRSGSYTHLALDPKEYREYPTSSHQDSPSSLDIPDSGYQQNQSFLGSIQTSNLCRASQDLPPNQGKLDSDAKPTVSNDFNPSTLNPVALQSDRWTKNGLKNPTRHTYAYKEEETAVPVTHAGEVTPRYYPVRKAKNIKLYSLPTESTPQSPPSSSCDHLTTGGKNLSPVTPVFDTSLNLHGLSPVSPGLYASTPKAKSANLPLFETPISSIPSSKPILYSHLPHPHSQYYSAIPNLQNHHKGHNPPINNFSQIQDSSDAQNKDNGKSFEDNCKENIPGYGFNSSYRNKVIVDEADWMKRRRKGRGSEAKVKALLGSSGDFDFDQRWLEAAGLDSPPLATSTLSRDVPADVSPSKSSQRKKFRRDGERNDTVLASGTCTGRCEIENNPVQAVDKINSRCKIGQYHFVRKAGNNTMYCYLMNSSIDNVDHSREKTPHQQSLTGRISNDYFSSTSTPLNGMISKKDMASDKTWQQSSSNFQRKFNTNSVLFPDTRTPRLCLRPPLITTAGSGISHQNDKGKSTCRLAMAPSPQTEFCSHNHVVLSKSNLSCVCPDLSSQSIQTSSNSIASPRSPSSQRIKSKKDKISSSSVHGFHHVPGNSTSKTKSSSQPTHHLALTPRTHPHHHVRMPDLSDVTPSTNQSGVSAPNATEIVNRRKVTFDFEPLTVDTTVGQDSSNNTAEKDWSSTPVVGYFSTNADSSHDSSYFPEHTKPSHTPRSPHHPTSKNNDPVASRYPTSQFPQHHRPSTVKICYSSDW